mgnify:CR=1 FL=1
MYTIGKCFFYVQAATKEGQGNNSEYYESLLDSSRKENRTLQLTISDLNTSRDSIVQ